MVQQMIDLLEPALRAGAAPVLVDATLGAGGHAELALRTYPHITVIGIDRDESALTISWGAARPVRRPYFVSPRTIR